MGSIKRRRQPGNLLRHVPAHTLGVGHSDDAEEREKERKRLYEQRKTAAPRP